MLYHLLSTATSMHVFRDIDQCFVNDVRSSSSSLSTVYITVWAQGLGRNVGKLKQLQAINRACALRLHLLTSTTTSPTRPRR